MMRHWLLAILFFLPPPTHSLAGDIPVLVDAPSIWPEHVPRGEVLVLEPLTDSEATGWKFLPEPVRWWLSVDGEALIETVHVDKITAAWAEVVEGKPVISLATIVVDGLEPPAPPIPPLPPPVITELTAVLVEESDNRTVAEGALLLSPKLHSWFDASPRRHFRPFDDDIVDQHEQTPKDLRRWFAMAEGKVLPYLILHGENGQVVYAGPLPKEEVAIGVEQVTADALLKLLEQYAPKETEPQPQPAPNPKPRPPPKPQPVVEPCLPGQKCSIPHRRGLLFWRR